MSKRFTWKCDACHLNIQFRAFIFKSGPSLEGDWGEKVSLSWLTSPYFELREKFKFIEHIGKSKICTKTSPWNPEKCCKTSPSLKALGWPLLNMFRLRPKMPFGQRNVATYIHNICKWHLGSKMPFGQRNVATYIHNICKWHLEENRVVEAEEDNTKLTTLISGAKYSVLKYTEASTVQIHKIVRWTYTASIFQQITLIFASRESSRLVARNPYLSEAILTNTHNIWAEPWENVSYVICEQQRRTSVQSDQRLCCSLLR